MTISGTLPDEFSFSNLKVSGDLILSTLDGELFDFDGIEVDGDTIIE